MKKEQKYDILSLVKTFEEHSVIAIKQQEEWKKSFQKNSPGEPIPDSFRDDFNLPKALLEICKCIKKLEGLKDG